MLYHPQIVSTFRWASYSFAEDSVISQLPDEEELSQTGRKNSSKFFPFGKFLPDRVSGGDC